MYLERIWSSFIIVLVRSGNNGAKARIINLIGQGSQTIKMIPASKSAFTNLISVFYLSKCSFVTYTWNKPQCLSTGTFKIYVKLRQRRFLLDILNLDIS